MKPVGVTQEQSVDAAVSIRVFGGVGLDTPDGPLRVGGRRLQRLFALLVIRYGRIVTIDWLAEHLWRDEDRPDAYEVRLRTYLSRLRQALPERAAEWIETVPGGYRLAAPPDAVEHVRAGRLRERAREARDTGDPLAARRLLDDALAVWRGEPFRELEDLDWARTEIEQLHLDRLEMLEERWETELALGRHTQITGELGSFLAEQPLRERAARQCALALHRCGRTAEALRVLASFRRRLADDTGLEPSPALVDLERSLLDGDASLDAPEGRPLRGYRLVEEVGAGAFAVVWRAIQPSVDRDVAIKQIRPEFASRPEFIRRFEAEARTVARIEHPHVVPLIDFWRDPDAAYLVMRWLGGGTLQRRLDDGPLPVDETLAIAEQIGGALSAAHAHGVVHRDVKPSNILFDGAGHAYLTDFGIALGETDQDGPEAALSPGSPAYGAPEQLRGGPAGPAADVFGLGAVLHECLVGSPPPPTGGAAETLFDPRSHEPFSEHFSRVGRVPPSVAAAIARATAPDPADRFASTADLLIALGGVPEGPVFRSDPARRARPENPYVGLRAFDDGDAGRFFGRDRLVDEIVERFADVGVRSRCVVVVGPSGSGKSSAVRAGVVPALRRGEVPGSGDWFTTTMMPGDDVFASLESALLRVAVDPPPSLLAQLRDGERGILRGVQRCITEGRVLLVIDQLEELFTTHDPVTVDRFLTAVSVAVEDPSSPLRLIATVRADHYDRPLRHPSFARIVKETAVEITPLAADELIEAITAPARQVGVTFEPGLVARITADTVGRASPLPLLEYALSELFERRSSDRTITVAEYEAVAGIAGALSARAEILYSEATPAERAAIRSVFGRLANPNDADTRRRVALADLGDDEATRRVVERFGRARLLTFDHDGASREPTVEVAHEALLREWPRAVTWLEEDRDLRRIVGSIDAAATAWDRGGRQSADLYRGGRLETARDVAASNPDRLRPVDHEFIEASHARAEAARRTEQRRLKRLRRQVTATAVALCAALLAGGIALVEQRRADRAAGAAESAAAEAELATILSRSTAIAPEQPDVALLLALEARRRAPGTVTDRGLLDALSAAELGRTVGEMPRLPAATCHPDVPSRRIGPDGLSEFGVVDGQLLIKDLVTGEIATRGPAPSQCVMWAEDVEAGRRWADADFGDRQWTAAIGGEWIELEVSNRSRLLGGYTVGPGDLLPGGLLHPEAVEGRILYWRTQTQGQDAWVPRAVVVDEETLEPVGGFVPDLVLDEDGSAADPVTASSTADGLFAIGGRPSGAGDGSGIGLLVVLDARDGTEILRVRRPTPVTAVAFDRMPRVVVVGGEDGRVEIIDLESQDVVGVAALSGPGPVISVGVRSDGRIVAVGRETVEVFDGDGDRVGVPVAIPASELARVRRDGTVVVVSEADPDTIRVIDPAGGPLAESGWNVDPSARVGFGAGQAAVTSSAGDLEIVDLTSGTRSRVELSLATDERFQPVAAVPEEDGLLAWDRDGSVVRWEGGLPVQRLELWQGSGDVTLARNADESGTAGSESTVGAGAATVFLNGFPQTVQRFESSNGMLEVIADMPSPPRATVAASPASNAGVHVLLDDGTVRTYDRTGRSVGQVTTGLGDPQLVVSDPVTGLVGVGGRSGAAVVDPTSGKSERIVEIGQVASLGFARDGDLLVVVEADGTVRLWDVERSTLAGTLWSGDGTAPQSAPPWYDAAVDSVWVATSGTILRLPLDPDRWADRLCDLVERELTTAEWDRFVPGEAPRRDVCD